MCGDFYNFVKIKIINCACVYVCVFSSRSFPLNFNTMQVGQFIYALFCNPIIAVCY